MLNRLLLFIFLFCTWIVLSGFFTPLFIVLGALSCFLAVFISVRTRLKNEQRFNALPLILSFPVYICYLLKEIIISGIDVTRKMWQIEPEISPAVAWIPTSFRDDMRLTIYGNSITLTPGTMTMEVTDEGLLHIHALNAEGIESLRSGDMAAKVVKLTEGAVK